MNLTEVGPHSISQLTTPRGNFETGQTSIGKQIYRIPFTKEDYQDLVKAKEWDWKAGQQPNKNLVKVKINTTTTTKLPTDFQQSLSECKGEFRLLFIPTHRC